MRRSHHEVAELVEARVADFVNGDSTESVLRASLKALGLDEDDTNLEVHKAKLRTHSRRGSDAYDLRRQRKLRS